MKNTFVRKALPGEEAEIHEAHMRSIREISIKDHGEKEVSGWGNRPLGDRWIKAVRDEVVWVIEHLGVVQGVAYLCFLKEDDQLYGYVNALYLTPEVKGLGLGRQLMEKMIEQAKERKISYIKLESTITAHEFYKSFGFESNGGPRSEKIGGVPVRGLPMILKL